MSKRAVGFYPDEDGEILVNFESGQKGVPLKNLIPERARGEAFDDFNVRGYFALAQMVLATVEDLQTFSNDSKFKDPNQKNSKQENFPQINSQDLALCTPNGNLDLDQTAQVFSIVAVYWENPKSLAIHPGFVATALRKGLCPKEILKLIRQNTQFDPQTGEPKWVVPEASLQGKLLGALLPPDIPAASITRSTLENLYDWLSAVPRDAKEFSSQRRKVGDLVFLGLMDFENKVDFEAAALARDYIWDRIEEKSDFKGLWRHIQTRKGFYPAADSEADYSRYNALVAALYDQETTNTDIASEVTQLAKTGVPVLTDHLCYAAWLRWQLARSGRYESELLALFNREPANWLASEGANELLGEVFLDGANRFPDARKAGRNDPCPCGSGKKFKKCCGQ